MKEELVKELKVAGFPQKVGRGFYVHDIESPLPNEPEWLDTTDWTGIEHLCYIPTFGELVEQIAKLREGYTSFILTNDGVTWNAQYGFVDVVGKRGKTMEEAAAKLWLHLLKEEKESEKRVAFREAREMFNDNPIK